MRKLFIGLISILTAALFSAQFTSCEKYVLPDVSFDSDTLTFGYQAATKPVTLNSNVIWKIELSFDAQEWIKLSVSGDTVGRVIDVTVNQNDGVKRKQILTVETEAIKKTLTIIQDAGPEVK